MGDIYVGERQRPADAKKVAELAKSIEQVGLLQPIGVVEDASEAHVSYRLVFGLHRLQAFALLEHTEIDAYVLPQDLEPEEYLLIELQENSTRHDLTRDQRKAFAAETGRLLQKMADNPKLQNLDLSWWKRIWTTTGITEQTLRNWWKAFCDEHDLVMTPRQALAPHRERFFTWLEAKQAEAEAERQRKEEEGEREQRDLHLAELLEEVEDCIRMYGWDLVYTRVLAPVLTAQGVEEDD